MLQQVLLKIVLMEEESFKILVVGAVIMGEEVLEAFLFPFGLMYFLAVKYHIC